MAVGSSALHGDANRRRVARAQGPLVVALLGPTLPPEEDVRAAVAGHARDGDGDEDDEAHLGRDTRRSLETHCWPDRFMLPRFLRGGHGGRPSETLEKPAGAGGESLQAYIRLTHNGSRI